MVEKLYLFAVTYMVDQMKVLSNQSSIVLKLCALQSTEAVFQDISTVKIRKLLIP